MVNKQSIVLASSSVYRKQQLASLGLSFTVSKPSVDESVKHTEKPEKLSVRLTVAKAQKIKNQYPAACVIGSDQVCSFNGQIFGKPGSKTKAVEQLQIFSGNCIEFFTSLCVINEKGDQLLHTDITKVNFRVISQQEINRYVETETPLDCAGSFKIESLGLSLFESVESKDPSALMGLPLIKLCEFLRSFGYQIP